MSRITEVKTVLCGFGGYFNYCLVKVTTDDGVYGWGDSSLAGNELATATIVREHFGPLLVGRDPLDHEDIWQTLFRSGYWRGGPVFMSAIAGVDMALWDIKGKVANLPVYQLLGGRCRDGALTYTHAGGRDFSEVTEHVRAAMERGFKVVRCQVAIPGLQGTYGSGGAAEPFHGSTGWTPHTSPGPAELFEPGPYLRTVPAMFEHLRSEVGEEIDLCHDTHERLLPIEAARLAKSLEPYHLFFLEDLLSPEHQASFRMVRAASTTPLAMGELYTSTDDCLQVMSEQLIDFIRCDLAHSGGISEGRRIATIGAPYGVRTAWHGPGDISPITHASNVHLDLAVPNFGVQEWSGHIDAVRDVITGGPFVRDGYAHVTDSPGLGTDVDEAAAERYPYQKAWLPLARRADGSVQDW